MIRCLLAVSVDTRFPSYSEALGTLPGASRPVAGHLLGAGPHGTEHGDESLRSITVKMKPLWIHYGQNNGDPSIHHG